MKKQTGKRIAAVILLMLLLLLTACGAGKDMEKTSSIWYFGDTESEDPLRICMDIHATYSLDSAADYQTAEKAMNELLSVLRTELDTQEIVIEFIPNGMTEDGADTTRATAISRLRVEMLAGEGPDVFISRYMRSSSAELGTDSEYVLFNSPLKAMESGSFLPLDDYIANHAKRAEWESFPKAIMDAGKNDEGQQIIPVSYTLPVIIYPKEEFDYTPDRELSWNDLLTDPALKPYTAELADCRDYFDLNGETHYSFPNHLDFVLGELADYKAETPLFSEEELLQRVAEIMSINPTETPSNAQVCMLGVKPRSYYSYPITLLPLYSDDGGVTARIESYAAVNRNTTKPDAAFAVIDTLLSTDVQQNYKIYSKYLCYESFESYGGFPMYDTLKNVKTSMDMYANKENFDEFCELREQITHANFGAQEVELLYVLPKCDAFPEQTEALVHEAYTDFERRVRE